MKQLLRLLLVFIVLQVFNKPAFSQLPPFYNEIQAFKHQDSLNAPPKNAILFIGSSSFKMWRDVQDYFPGHPIINRGFGGSSLPDAIRYVNDIVIPYHPRQVVIYVGENDFPAPGVTADTVFNRFTTFFNLVRKGLPGTDILFVSFKPSPSRLKYLPEMKRANEMIENYLKKRPRTGFVDVYSRMLDTKGDPMPHLFLADRLHMTPDGYKIWQEAIKPFLK